MLYSSPSVLVRMREDNRIPFVDDYCKFGIGTDIKSWLAILEGTRNRQRRSAPAT